MKTFKEWRASGQTFEEFFKEGDEIDEAAFYYFLEVVYPAAMGKFNSFLVGEANRHNHKGEPVYSMFTQHGGNYSYEGETTIRGFNALLKIMEAAA